MNTVNFNSKLNGLPVSVQKEILRFIEELILKYQKPKQKSSKFKFDWEGGLSDFKNKFTSVELQHNINSLR